MGACSPGMTGQPLPACLPTLTPHTQAIAPTFGVVGGRAASTPT